MSVRGNSALPRPTRSEAEGVLHVGDLDVSKAQQRCCGRDCRVKRHNAEALFPSESALIDELPEVLAFRREEDLAEGLGRQEVQILIALRLE